MCGGAILANLTKQPGPRRLTEGALWPEKKKAKRGGAGGRRYPAGFEDDEDFQADFEEFEVNSGGSDLELGAEDDDDVVEIKLFAAKRNFSGASMQLKPTVKVALNNPINTNGSFYPSADYTSNKQIVQVDNMAFIPTMSPAAPIEDPVMNLHSDQGSNSFSCSDLGWENETKTPDITSITPVSTIAEGDESEFVNNNSNGSMTPPVMENNTVDLTDELTDLEPYMRFLLDGGASESIDSLLNLDGSQDVVSDMDLWSFDDIPISGIKTMGDWEAPAWHLGVA
ncbi:hypothetical protein EJB05_20424 [Eragrostis curvula]|uniref:Uncharacterized protein n=1 Tax=Eragrostis curvula TaxID=38414 RepID=A0A5J9V0K4_9POAL|nr:hypothetical protein EJB05_20424 [Eragrostis curvula]